MTLEHDPQDVSPAGGDVRPAGSVWKTVGIITATTLFLLLLLECGARIAEIWKPPFDVDFGMGFDAETRLFAPMPDDPSLMKTSASKLRSFPECQFRLPKPTGTLRIFMLGGSSVNYLGSHFYGLNVLLEKALSGRFQAVEIINVGGLSYGSQRLVPIAAEVLKYEPDLILLYSGHNEFEELEQLKFSNIKSKVLQEGLSHLALFRFLRDQKAQWTMRRIYREHNAAVLKNPDVDYTRVWKVKFTEADIRERMEAYRRNLSLIATLCRDRDVPLIIGSVPSNLWQPRLAPEDLAKFEPARKLYAEGRYDEGKALTRELLTKVPRHQASDVENGIIRDTARAFSLPVAEVESAVTSAEPHGVPGETLFSDECHLTEDGKLILLAEYAKAVLEHFGVKDGQMPWPGGMVDGFWKAAEQP